MRVRHFLWFPVLALPLLLSGHVMADELSDLRQQLGVMREQIRMIQERIEKLEKEKDEQTTPEAGKKDKSKAPNVVAPFAEQVRIGGSIRYRLENQANFDFDDSKSDDREFSLLRTRLDFDVQVLDKLRAFVQIQDSRTFGEEPSTMASTDNIDLHQGYLEASNIGGTQLNLRLGRQEMRYGKMRLIGAPNWRTNVGRSFDELKLWHDSDNLRIDLFAAKIDEEDLDDPAGDKDEEFGGVYLTLKSIPRHTVDSYFLVKLNHDAEETTGEDGQTGDLGVYTVGGRLQGKTGGVDYEVETSYQFGEHATDDIVAWAANLVVGYTFDTRIRPRIGLEYNFASGDSDPHDGDYETFDHLYPANHFRYGYIDLVGFRNLRNFRLTSNVRATSKLRLALDYHFFWLDDVEDSLYKLSGAVSRAGSLGADDEVGREIDFTVWYDVHERLRLMGGYSHFSAGDFLDDTGPSDDADWIYVQSLLSF